RCRAGGSRPCQARIRPAATGPTIEHSSQHSKRIGNKNVGWVERSATHRSWPLSVGCAPLHPPYTGTGDRQQRTAERPGTPRAKGIPHTLERSKIVADVFQDIEHEHEIVLRPSLEAFPECGNAYLFSPFRVDHDRGVGLKPVDLSEAFELVEEQAIAAADVE